jgi:23S rRNA (guanine2445-N2)-methyltransferase / 23S rRNA (guanine2069-N7)-methyltransferase
MNMRAVTVTCPGGLESLVAAEMSRFGIRVGTQARGAVTGEATLEACYRACLWSRCANHVLLRIASWAGGGDADALYAQLDQVGLAGLDTSRTAFRYFRQRAQ